MTAHVIDKEIRQIIDEQYQRALEILSSNRTLVDRTADALLESETIQGEELKKLAAAVKKSGLNDNPNFSVNNQALAA